MKKRKSSSPTGWKAARAEVSSAEWRYGLALISEDYFVTYAEEMAADVGAIDPKAGWPLQHIDWDAAAEALKQDYSSVELDGRTFYFRD